MGAFSCGVPIFVWVLINADVVVVIKMGAYIHGVLICVGAYYPDFMVFTHNVVSKCLSVRYILM